MSAEQTSCEDNCRPARASAAEAAGGKETPYGLDVSFVITVYNKAPYLEPMLRGLARQEGSFSREFIFVDDGSQDDSVGIIRAFTESWPNVRIIQQANAGPSAATNTGGFLARGEYIKLVDADDVLTPFATGEMLRIARAHGLDFLYGMQEEVEEPEARSLSAAPGPMDLTVYPDPLREFFVNGMAGASNVLARAETFREVGGCDPEVFVQDVSLPLRFARTGRMGRTSLPCNFAPAAVEGRVMGLHAEMIYTMSISILNFLDAHPETAADLQRIAFRRCAGRAWKWARRRQGANVLSRAFRLYLLSYLPVWDRTSGMIRSTLHVWDEEKIHQISPDKAASGTAGLPDTL